MRSLTEMPLTTDVPVWIYQFIRYEVDYWFQFFGFR